MTVFTNIYWSAAISKTLKGTEVNRKPECTKGWGKFCENLKDFMEWVFVLVLELQAKFGLLEMTRKYVIKGSSMSKGIDTGREGALGKFRESYITGAYDPEENDWDPTVQGFECQDNWAKL